MPRSLPNPRRVVPFKGPNDEFIIGRVLKRALMGIARARIAVFDKRRVVSMWRGTLDHSRRSGFPVAEDDRTNDCKASAQ